MRDSVIHHHVYTALCVQMTPVRSTAAVLLVIQAGYVKSISTTVKVSDVWWSLYYIGSNYSFIGYFYLGYIEKLTKVLS